MWDVSIYVKFRKVWRISGETHPVLLQLNQLPQPLQEGRLRDLPIRKWSTIEHWTSKYDKKQSWFAVWTLVLHIIINATVTIGITTTPVVKINLWKASPSSADVHPSQVVPRPEQAHLPRELLYNIIVYSLVLQEVSNLLNPWKQWIYLVFVDLMH